MADGEQKKDTEAAHKLQEPKEYNRTVVDVVHVGRLVEVIRSGATLPPVLIDQETLCLIDGVHRWKAYQRALGPEAEVPVIRRAFASEAARFAAGLEANARHGRALSAADMRHSILIAERIGLDLEVVRTALLVTPETFAAYQKQFVLTEGGVRIPLSRSNLHLAGLIIPDGAADSIRRGSGSTIRSLARQLTRHLGGGYMDWADEGTVASLRELRALLERVLAERVA